MKPRAIERMPVAMVRRVERRLFHYPVEKLLRPQVPGRKWGPGAINVAAQEHEPDAMLT